MRRLMTCRIREMEMRKNKKSSCLKKERRDLLHLFSEFPIKNTNRLICFSVIKKKGKAMETRSKTRQLSLTPLKWMDEEARLKKRKDLDGELKGQSGCRKKSSKNGKTWTFTVVDK